jgi:glycosyltransferase involved in cell wall biosynthesis
VRRLHAIIPDSVPDQLRPSGGNTYDQRLLDGLDSLGWSVAEHLLPGAWPDPDAASRRALEDVAAGLPAGDTVLVDGLIASNSPGVLVPLAHRVPLVVLVHLPVEGQRERAVLDAAAAVLTTSAWTRDRLLALYRLDPRRVHVAEPGVDLSPVAPGTTAGGELLCVAAVTPIKGHDLLVAALATLRDLPWRCTCAGPLAPDPGFVEHVTAQAHRAGIQDRVQLVGPLDRTALDQAYAAADAIVHPSRVETYGMVVTEALARGLPVIGTSVGGLPAALGHGAVDDAHDAGEDGRPGLLVPADDAAALAAALRAWLTDPALRERLRHRARERRLSLHPWSRTAEQVSAVLATLVRTSAAGAEPD